jgi:hypothetical protein
MTGRFPKARPVRLAALLVLGGPFCSAASPELISAAALEAALWAAEPSGAEAEAKTR